MPTIYSKLIRSKIRSTVCQLAMFKGVPVRLDLRRKDGQSTNPWQNLLSFISKKTGGYNIVTTFEKMFGVSNDTAHKQCINCLFLYLKFYIYRCRFQKLQPNFCGFYEL